MIVEQYITRRNKLYEDSKAGYVVCAFDALQQTNDSAAPFIQEANFFYLTGIDEPGWLLIVNAKKESTLVAPDVSEMHRIFDGGLSDAEAKEISGVDAVVSRTKGDSIIEQLLRSEPRVGAIGPDAHEKYFSFTINPAPKRLYDKVSEHASDVLDIRPLLAKMRGRKDEKEIALIKRAVAITAVAFKQARQVIDAASHEYNLEAEFSYVFRNEGVAHAYEPIVASGVNACTLHYVKNNAKLPDNGLVLIDIGARLDGYAADITRTYAIGTPTERQRAVHAAVEKAHHDIIALLKPGLSVKEYHEKVDEIMKVALKSLDLFQEPDDYQKYFPHSISHGLGLDVHDSLGAPKEFEPGMILTVEPGIYIPEEEIGVRIEDDILITEDGHENLSGHLPTSL